MAQTILIVIVNSDEPTKPTQADPLADVPIDVPARRALFASLREVYGEMPDAKRLAVISKLAGREITSMSSRGNMTMADAHRVLGILDTLRS